MKQVVIAIHGLGNKPQQNLLAKWWKRAINEGLCSINRKILHVPFVLVYWADINYSSPLKTIGISPDDPNYLKEPYSKGSLPTVSGKPSMKSRFYHYVDRYMDKIFQNTELSASLTKITDRVLRRYFSDLDAYYNQSRKSLAHADHTATEDIRDRLYRTLRKNRKKQILLIAHSMGSIVAFDVLSRYQNELSVHTLVTIGSPLGLPFVKNRIFKDQKSAEPSITEPHTPNCVRHFWFNLSDPEDKVAMDRSLADDYAANHLNVGVTDKSIFNNYLINGNRNPHKSYGYLRSPEMSGIVADFLNSGERGRFIRYWLKAPV